MASSKIDPSYMEEMLTCSVCLELVREPQTLNQCLHHFCKPCVQELLKKQTNPTSGVVCPLCRKFTAADGIRENHFVKELVSLHMLAEGNGDGANIKCEKCDDPNTASESGWRCVDCRCYMCNSCKTQHSKFTKGHRVLELNEETKLTIDQLLFCDTHTEEPLKFYCNQCKQILCITCHVVTHRNHEITTIENALENMVPHVKKFIIELGVKNQKVQEGIDKYEKEEYELREHFASKREDIERKANERVEDIRKEERVMKLQLATDEENQIRGLNSKKGQLINTQKEIINARNVAQASIDKAQHISLLSELVQTGLYGNLEKLATEHLPNVEMQTARAELIFHDHEWNTVRKKRLLGRIERNPLKEPIDRTRDNCITSSRYFPGDFSEVMKNPIQQVITIKLDSQCQDVVIAEGMVWIPLRDKKVIKVYSTGGTFVQQFQLDGKPTRVDVTETGEIVTSCYDAGFFLKSTMDVSFKKLDTGSYSDVCVFDGACYALNYKNCEIVRYCKNNQQWHKVESISFQKPENSFMRDTLLVRVTEAGNMEYLVCFFRQRSVHSFNQKGELIAMFGNEIDPRTLHSPSLCGIDARGQILVSNEDEKICKILTPSGWNQVYTDTQCLLNVRIHSNTLWMCKRGHCEYYVYKYTYHKD